ncbi:hypothetical protein QBC34DRAFT_419043 [Podospora aff. communis PSN243]|uniref:CCHC-type domain-containing protein n=1 Tax=Podospora aff. communis PSN243 TaxID=3040156 RepID=A0AAV9FYE5_9PEZI|nr:hypothetical protein QBC34DRAFT_419043 [Podospora aff. communis PSN243]
MATNGQDDQLMADKSQQGQTNLGNAPFTIPRSTEAVSMKDSLKAWAAGRELNGFVKRLEAPADLRFFNNVTSLLEHLLADQTVGPAVLEFLHFVDATFHHDVDTLQNRDTAIHEASEAVDRMTKSICDLKNTVTAKDLEIARLQGANEAYKGGRAGGVRAATAKDPTPFTAAETDTKKRQIQYESWRKLILVRWSQDITEFPHERNKILHVAGLLADKASQSIAADFDRFLKHQLEDPSTWPWPSGQALIDVLDKKWKVLNLRTQADQEVRMLKQEGQFNNFADFMAEFTVLCDQAELANVTRVAYLQEKVKPRLRSAIAVQLKQPEEDDWAGWSDLVTTLNRNQEREDFAKKITGGTNAGSQNSQNTQGGNRQNNQSQNNQNGQVQNNPAKTTTQGGSAMDLDAVNLNRISPEEMARRMANGLCRRCAKPGHIAANCRSQVNADGNGWGRGGGRGALTNGRGGYNGGHNQGGFSPTFGRGSRGQGFAPQGGFGGGFGGYNPYGNGHQPSGGRGYNVNTFGTPGSQHPQFDYTTAATPTPYEHAPYQPTPYRLPQFYGFASGEVTGEVSSEEYPPSNEQQGKDDASR